MTLGFTPHAPASRKPMQVRFFRNATIPELERELNGWLAEKPGREIVEIRQSVAEDVVVSVWYIE